MGAKPVLAVVIGRFQGPHAGHAHLLAQAAATGDRVLVLVGSAGRPRSPRNPFTYGERRMALKAMAGRLGIADRTAFLPLIDTLYDDDLWVSNVRLAVSHHCQAVGAHEVVLVGFSKDRTSEYLRWFGGPGHEGWRSEPAASASFDGRVLSATDLRRAIICGEGNDPSLGVIYGEEEVQMLHRIVAANPAAFEAVRKEWEFLDGYRARTRAAEEVLGYPIPINTADPIVIQSGHVLLVRRGGQPGRGLLALPGGHVNPGETGLQAAIRELIEETGIDIPKGVLRGRISSKNGALRNPADARVFDHPERSERGWVRTQAFRWELEDRNRLERVKGGDDAAEALWVPISEITPLNMFEDHFDILQAMVPGVSFSYPALLAGHAL